MTLRCLLLWMGLASLGFPSWGGAQIEPARSAFEKEDYAGAYKLYQPLAEKGLAEAQYRMGMMRKFGWGTDRDHAIAAKWFQAAADQNHADAQFELGIYYKDGRGVERDFKRSATLFTQASEQGVGMAQLNLGRYYLAGQGVGKDPVAAYYWLTVAAVNGYMDGMALRVSAAKEMTPEQIKDTDARAKQGPRPTK